ncbi:ankyrin repeat protein [Necator americanus]|uniref:Ankyrin repeat protein n=1 Tax=Necator americanus TaxID=51031 RepID=W2TA49_NECAM|nr:ankyrin repeat protein [Necator americanus]ETN78900.1 ankyrin repeat protein [Necator americanus]
MNWLQLGQRVFVEEREARHAEKLHEYSHLPWDSIYNVMTLGKIGSIADISEDWQTVVVRFYLWSRNDEFGIFGDNQLMAVDVVWHARALRPLYKIHFEIGDHAVLEQVDREEQLEVHFVTIRSVVSSIGDDQLFCLESLGKQMFFWTQEDRPSDALLPIYTDSNFGCLSQVFREYSDLQVDTSASRLRHGVLSSNEGSQMATAIANWDKSDSGPSHFAMTAQNHFDQLNCVSENGYTPLMCAVADGNWTSTVTLLSLGAQRDAADANGNTLLHMAAERGHVMILEGLLMFLGNEVNRPNSDGNTPMHLAARGQHAACLDRLLNTNHLHSNIQNANGDSPMHIVCGLPESPTKIAMVGRLLANARLNLHLYNEDELTPVHIAISKDCYKTMELIMQSRPQQLNADTGNGFSPLLLAAFYGRRKCTESLIELNADVCRFSKLGRTALHLALETWHGSVDKDMDRLACVQALVQAGCPLNAQDCDGQTAAHLLVRELNRFTETSRECNVVNLPNTVFYAINSCNDLVNMNLHDIASRVRPHWQLACLCFLAARGADVTVNDRFGISVVDGCLDERIRNLIFDIAEKRPRSCLPMTKATFVEFDPSGVTMCTFNCEDSQADVYFVPCGHRVRHKKNTAISEEEQRRILAEEEIERITAAAAKQAKLDAEREKLRELEELKEKLAQLEMETSCTICMDARPSIVFNCGHTACSDCTPLLKSCHICRQTITKRQTLYA